MSDLKDAANYIPIGTLTYYWDEFHKREMSYITVTKFRVQICMYIRLYKLERILMQQVDLKSALNFKEFL